jgi:type I restriction enzyme S subunit
MSLPLYPDYQDSAVPWVGDVPADWRVTPLLGVAQERGNSNIGMLENNLLSLSYGRIIRKDIDSNDGLLPESFETYQIVEPGDIVLRLTDLQNDKRSLRSALVTERGIITSAYLAIGCTGIDSRYMAYLLRAYDLTKVFYSMGGGLRQSMKFSDVKRMPVLVPGCVEQQAIANFLDCETSKIDTLVAEQEKLLSLLAEKRQATISHAVTCGLNPDAPMKDSGVAWLGEVPAHWEGKKVGYDCNVLSGFAFPSAGFSLDDAGVKLLRGVNVGVGALRWNDVVYWNRVADDGLDAFELRPGDIVLGMDRPWISEGLRVARVSENDTPCLLLQRVATIRPNSKLNADYLYYLFRAGYFFHHCAPEMTGVSVPHISPEQIRSFVVPVPPLNEQSDIAAFIEAECMKLDALDVEGRHSIDLLKERRSALIAAAVTGKIDVRYAVPEELAA